MKASVLTKFLKKALKNNKPSDIIKLEIDGKMEQTTYKELVQVVSRLPQVLSKSKKRCNNCENYDKAPRAKSGHCWLDERYCMGDKDYCSKWTKRTREKYRWEK
jgi:hypothetical protein